MYNILFLPKHFNSFLPFFIIYLHILPTNLGTSSFLSSLYSLPSVNSLHKYVPSTLRTDEPPVYDSTYILTHNAINLARDTKENKATLNPVPHFPLRVMYRSS